MPPSASPPTVNYFDHLPSPSPPPSPPGSEFHRPTPHRPHSPGRYGPPGDDSFTPLLPHHSPWAIHTPDLIPDPPPPPPMVASPFPAAAPPYPTAAPPLGAALPPSAAPDYFGDLPIPLPPSPPSALLSTPTPPRPAANVSASAPEPVSVPHPVLLDPGPHETGVRRDDSTAGPTPTQPSHSSTLAQHPTRVESG